MMTFSSRNSFTILDCHDAAGLAASYGAVPGRTPLFRGCCRCHPGYWQMQLTDVLAMSLYSVTAVLTLIYLYSSAMSEFYVDIVVDVH